MVDSDDERVREETWSGSERQRHEQRGCLPPKDPPLKRAAYTVPAGTTCGVKRIDSMQWRRYTTKKELGFERAEGYRNGHYDFRFQGWLLCVPREFVLHRADMYPPGV